MANELLQENGDTLLKEDDGRIVTRTDWTAHNAIISALLPSIEAYQASYISSHPYYFQGLRTHAITPVENRNADRLSFAPSVKVTTWSDTGLIGQQFPFSIEINEYVAPGNNKGWQIIFHSSDGEKYIVSSVVGSETLPAALSRSVKAAPARPFFTITDPTFTAESVVPVFRVIFT